MMDVNNLTILSFNTASLRRRRQELELLVQEKQPHFILLQETSDKGIPTLHNYRLIDSIPAGRGTRGSAIFASSKDGWEKLGIPQSTGGMETLGIVFIQNGSSRLRIINAYNSPANKIPVPGIIELVNDKTPTVIIGDFNAKCNVPIHRNSNRNGQLLDDAAENGEIFIAAPTQYTRYDSANRSPSMIDFAITATRHSSLISNVHVLQDIGSDHRPILFTINERVQFSISTSKPLFEKADWLEYRKKISQNIVTAPQVSHDSASIDKCVAYMTELIREADAESIPRTKSSSKPNMKPKPLHIVLLIKEKQRLRKRLKQKNEYQLKPAINKLDKRIKREIKKSECDHIRKQWQDERNKSPHGFYRLARKILKPTATENSFPVKDKKGQRATTTAQKLQIFKTHFDIVFRAHEKDPNHEFEDSANAYIQNMRLKYSDVRKREWPKDMDLNVDRTRIVRILKKVKNTSPGEDNIFYDHIKNLPTNGLDYLANIYETTIEACYFPKQWKNGRVALIPKPGKDHSEPKNYRPITLLSALGKILERLINEIITTYVEDKHLIPESQAGYRKNRSSQDQLYRLSEDASKAVINGTVSMATLFDVEKAFDRLWQEGFALKLQKASVPEPVIALLVNYLTNRTIQIKLDKLVSDPIHLETGTPQGSCLSGTIWGLWQHDIPQPNASDHTFLSQYADDIASWCNAPDHVTARQNLQKYNNKLIEWCREWKMKLASSKTQLIAFTKKKKIRRSFVYQEIENTKINHSDQVTFLGITFDFDMSWRSHSEILKNRLKQRVKMFAGITGPRLYPRADTDTSLKILKTMIEPIIYYAAAATCARPVKSYSELDKIIQNAARMALAIPRTISKDYVCRKANLKSSKETTVSLARSYINDERRSTLIKQHKEMAVPRKALLPKAKIKTPNTVLKS